MRNDVIDSEFITVRERAESDNGIIAPTDRGQSGTDGGPDASGYARPDGKVVLEEYRRGKRDGR